MKSPKSTEDDHLHIQTPLIESLPLSRKVEGRVWLKMESMQPSGSFKLRGIGRACRTHAAAGAKGFLCASGGNAGLAVAYCGRRLGLPTTVVVPETTKARAIELIGQEATRVEVHGASWQETHEHTVKALPAGWAYIHPFDDPLLWAGYGTLIEETVRQGVTPDAVVVAVGGGGLLCGVIEGLRASGLSHVPVVAVETIGADALASSLKQGRNASIPRIASIATSLGAKMVADTAFAYAVEHGVHSHVVTDRQALDACFQFLDDHRVLVEPACGAGLSAVYEPASVLKNKRDILVVVCGGAGVTMQQLEKWNTELSE